MINTSWVLFAIVFAVSLTVSSLAQNIPSRPLTTASSKPAQTKKATKPCTLTKAALPKIAGLQLGAAYEDILSDHPEIAEDSFFQKHLAEENGGLTHIKVPTIFNEPSRERPAEISLFFKDGLLTVIAPGGEDLEDYKSIDEAIAAYSKFFGVDTEQWTIHFGYAGELSCVDFSIFANSYSKQYSMNGNSMSIHGEYPLKQ